MRLFSPLDQTKQYFLLIIEKRFFPTLMYRLVLGTSVQVTSAKNQQQAAVLLSKMGHLDLFVSRLENADAKKDDPNVPQLVRQKFKDVPILIFNKGSAFDRRLWRIRRIEGAKILPKKFGSLSILKGILDELRRQSTEGKEEIWKKKKL